MKKWLSIAGVVTICIVGVLIWFIQANSVGTLCEQYVNGQNLDCEEVIADWRHQVAFIKTNEGMVFLRIDEDGKWLPSASILSFSDLQIEPIDWVATTDQNKSFVAVIATNNVKQTLLENPVKYYPNIFHLENYTVFYIPLAGGKPFLRAKSTRLYEQGELIHGKPGNQ